MNQLRLPIPPLRHEVMCFLENAAIILALCLLATLIREDTVCSIKKSIFLRSDKITKKASFVYISINEYVNFSQIIFLIARLCGWRQVIIFVSLSAI
ncbi:hypothetical protein AB6H32_04990 [Providencia hangzhouensis]